MGCSRPRRDQNQEVDVPRLTFYSCGAECLVELIKTVHRRKQFSPPTGRGRRAQGPAAGGRPARGRASKLVFARRWQRQSLHGHAAHVHPRADLPAACLSVKALSAAEALTWKEYSSTPARQMTLEVYRQTPPPTTTTVKEQQNSRWKSVSPQLLLLQEHRCQDLASFGHSLTWVELSRGGVGFCSCRLRPALQL